VKEKITRKGNHSGGKRGSDNGGTYGGGAKASKNPKYTKKRCCDTAPPLSPEPSDGAGVEPGDIDETFGALLDWEKTAQKRSNNNGKQSKPSTYILILNSANITNKIINNQPPRWSSCEGTKGSS
jgi:hypothetical protein